MLTAFGQRDLVEAARDAGAMAYLVKPFTKTDVVPAIEVAASRFAEITALEDEVAGLTDRLETRKAVERAKGLLMAKKKMSEPDAFRWIPAHRDGSPYHHADRGRGGRGDLRLTGGPPWSETITTTMRHCGRWVSRSPDLR